jgi:putative phosphoesterase
MQVGVISDIRGNLPALEAVLAHAHSQGVQTIWNLGDSVGYGANPDQVLRLLQQKNVTSILGNFDRNVLRFPKKKAVWREKRRPEVFLALYWAYENISEPSRDYLMSFQEDIHLRIGKTRILLTHGSPNSRKEGLYVDTPVKYLQQLLSKAKVDIVCCGHSLDPFYRVVKKGIFINPGGVGAQRDGDPRASYAVLDIDPRMMFEDEGEDFPLRCRHFRVEYDIERAASEIRKRSLPEAFAQVLIQGRELVSVLSEPEKWQVPKIEDQSWWVDSYEGKNREEVESEKLAAVSELAGNGSYDEDHVKQATYLALRLFDELQPLHRLGDDERFWLRCGSLLHDIGKGLKKHHLKALDMILNANHLPFSSREKRIIGSIARYHRRETPKDDHSHLAELPVVDQRVVTILSSLLRVADGLDASPRGNVIDLSCSYSPDEITIQCRVKSQAGHQKKRALGKGELMEFAFERELYIEWHRI